MGGASKQESYEKRIYKKTHTHTDRAQMTQMSNNNITTKQPITMHNMHTHIDRTRAFAHQQSAFAIDVECEQMKGRDRVRENLRKVQ